MKLNRIRPSGLKLCSAALIIASLMAVLIWNAVLAGIECFAAFSLIRLLTAVPITPGGLGVVELGLTGGLVAFGAGQEAAVAGVLLYRALTMLPVIVIGAICFLLWRRVAAPTPQAS